MGSSGSKGLAVAAETASDEELQKVFSEFDEKTCQRLVAAAKAKTDPDAGKAETGVAESSKPPTEMTVYYWGPDAVKNIYGRGIGIYLTLNQAGVKWTNEAPDKMPEGTAMAPPAVVIDGVGMGQTPAILIKLGEMYGLGGKNAEQKMRCMQAIEDMNDIFGEHAKFAENEELKKKRFTYLDKKLEGNKWLAGTDEPTVADFHGVFAFEWVKKKSIDFSDFPNTTKWLAAIQEYPVVKAMYDSCVDGRTMIPVD